MSLMSMPSKRSSMASFLFPMAILPDGQILIVKLIIPWLLLLITGEKVGIWKEKSCDQRQWNKSFINNSEC